MKPKKDTALRHQKRVTRSLKGVIVALLAIIGLFKISIGGVINIPVAFLFGDIFVVVFALLLFLAFSVILRPKTLRIKRRTFVLLSILGLLVLSSAVYAGSINNFFIDQTIFSTNLANMQDAARETISFNADISKYWYGYGGFLGEGIIYLLTPLGYGLSLAILIVLAVGLFVVIFWPLLMWLKALIKEYFRDLKKRRRVLTEAGKTGEEPQKELPERIVLADIVEEKKTPDNTLLKPVIPMHNNLEKPLPDKEVIQPLVAEEELKDPFELPSLDIEETFEAVHGEIKANTFEKVPTDDFESLQKAVTNEGSFEAVSFETVSARNETARIKKESIKEELDKAPLTPEPIDPTPKLEELVFDEEIKPVIRNEYASYRLPSLNLLEDAQIGGKSEENRKIAAANEYKINAFFNDFNIGARVVNWTIGSTFTRFEIALDATESVKSITPLLSDISLRLNGSSIRFEQIIPGKNTSGLEVANEHRTNVNFKECMIEISKNSHKSFVIPLGKDVAGQVISAPFNEFPHLLVAGSTGSGKSVFIHTVLTSLIMQHTPEDLRLLLIDPKRVELSQYNNIPHLLTPIVKEPSEAKIALERLIAEMEKRYRKFEAMNVGKISDYNEVIDLSTTEKMPTIITIVDEFADLFDSEKEVSSLVLKLVQKSRAAGIHLLIATQRPSVQVITGNIKANIPSRVAFMTASAIDSMTILGQGGAEMLLGNGDMLVESIATGSRGFLRVQSPYLPIPQVLKVTSYLRTHYKPIFHPEFIDLKEKVTYHANGAILASDDLYDSVLEFALENDTISISRIQQQFGVGWPRARQLYDLLLHNQIIELPDESNSAKGAVVIKNK